jgi:hypothetical protein
VQTLSSGKKIAGTVEGDAWQYFVTDTQPGQVMTWTVNSTAGDCDLYVRHDGIPSRSSYDQRDIGLGMSFSLQVTNAQSRRWYAGVHGFMQCNFTIGVTLVGTPPDSCVSEIITQQPHHGWPQEEEVAVSAQRDAAVTAGVCLTSANVMSTGAASIAPLVRSPCCKLNCG